MDLQSVVRWLLPKENTFYDMLEEIGALGHEAAKALTSLGSRPVVEVTSAVQAIEHRADDVVRRMEDALARTFVTPIDREDLHRLTSSLDDIVDLANLTARAFDLYHVERPTPAMEQLVEKLVACTKVIATAVPLLRKHGYDELLVHSRQIRQLEKEADTIYRKAISQLFSEAHDDFRALIKQKEALDDIETAVDHCDNVADLLSNLAVKHG